MKRYIVYGVLLFVLALTLAGCATSRIRPPAHAKVLERQMEVTGYCDCKKCCGWHRTWLGKPVIKGTHKRKKVGVTAAGTKARPGTIAADTARYPFGTIMYVPGYGYGRVEDRGSAIKQEKIDLYFKSHKEARHWGRQTVPVKVYLDR